MLKWPICAKLTGFYHSHSPSIINHCQSLGYLTPHNSGVIADVLAVSLPCVLERRSRSFKLVKKKKNYSLAMPIFISSNEINAYASGRNPMLKVFFTQSPRQFLQSNIDRVNQNLHDLQQQQQQQQNRPRQHSKFHPNRPRSRRENDRGRFPFLTTASLA